MKCAALLLTVGTVWAAILPQDEPRIALAAAAEVECREGFQPYFGLCVYTSDPEQRMYEEAVANCSAMRAFAPSIHSRTDLSFWSAALSTLTTGNAHFWLNAYCPKAGQPYSWMDGTSTDYLGPNQELANCEPGQGLHIHPEGFYIYPHSYAASVLCVYDPQLPVVVLDKKDPYCNCAVNDDGFPLDNVWKHNDIWLDVVVILDTSEAMGKKALEDAGALIESFISDGIDDFLVTDSKAPFYTRVLYNLNMTKEDRVQGKVSISKGVLEIDVLAAFEAALIMFKDGLTADPTRANARQVVYYMTDSDPKNNLNGLNQFKASKGVIIVNNFLQEGEVELLGLKDLASEGYYFVNADFTQALQSFCKANCFCQRELNAYAGSDPAIKAAGGCYHPAPAGVPYNRAKITCSNQRGFLATIHDEEKGKFLQQLISKANSKNVWIGYEKGVDGVFRWADESTDSYTNWDLNQPNNSTGAKCAYVDKSTAELKWGAGNCKAGFPYVCQCTPCSVGYKDC